MQRLIQAQAKLEKILADESLSPKEFTQIYQLKMAVDDQVNRAQTQEQGGGMLAQLMQGQQSPSMGGVPMSTPVMPQGRAPATVPLGQYGRPMERQGQGFLGSKGLLRGIV